MARSEPKGTRTTAERERGLVTALQDVADNVVTLAKNHVELVKLEARHDAKVYGEQTARAMFGVAFALLGFLILNAALILFVGWFGGLVGMAIAATVLSFAYMGIGYRIATTAIARMQELETMNQTKTQMQRSSEWVKEIREESSPRLPEPTSPSPETAMTKSSD